MREIFWRSRSFRKSLTDVHGLVIPDQSKYSATYACRQLYTVSSSLPYEADVESETETPIFHPPRAVETRDTGRPATRLGLTAGIAPGSRHRCSVAVTFPARPPPIDIVSTSPQHDTNSEKQGQPSSSSAHGGNRRSHGWRTGGGDCCTHSLQSAKSTRRQTKGPRQQEDACRVNQAQKQGSHTAQMQPVGPLKRK